MLSTDDFLREFPVVTRTDRDGEMLLVQEFVASKAPVESLLDIGGHMSSRYYAKNIRPFIGHYAAIDILADPETAQVVDNYITGNANSYGFGRTYDTVICVSTIEHAGSSTYKGDPKTEQETLFKKCLELANKYVWISFPVGLPYVFPNELSVITDKQLAGWEALLKGYKVKARFLYTQGAQAGHPWHEHAKRSMAVQVPYIDFIGNQSICVLEIEK